MAFDVKIIQGCRMLWTINAKIRYLMLLKPSFRIYSTLQIFNRSCHYDNQILIIAFCKSYNHKLIRIALIFYAINILQLLEIFMNRKLLVLP